MEKWKSRTDREIPTFPQPIGWVSDQKNAERTKKNEYNEPPSSGLLSERRTGLLSERPAQALKWQRLKPYETFAEMIDRHWDGIAAYCRPDNKVSLGFVEGLNNKIRVIQRRAYGLRDEEYLRLKVLTTMLPPL
jgi:transposase